MWRRRVGAVLCCLHPGAGMSIILDLDPEDLPVVARALKHYMKDRSLGDPDYDGSNFALGRILDLIPPSPASTRSTDR